LQVILRAAHWLQLWACLLPMDQRDTMVTGCNRLLEVTQDCYFLATGWRHISMDSSLYTFHRHLFCFDILVFSSYQTFVM
jgi:hypothetical protein